MHNLQEATERICELKGSLVAMDALIPALLKALPPDAYGQLVRSFEVHAEAARTVMLNTAISDLVLSTFERDVDRTRAVLAAMGGAEPGPGIPCPAEAVLLSMTRVIAFSGAHPSGEASGFFFRRDERLFVVTSRRVLLDEAGGRGPDRIEIEVHTDARDLSRRASCSIPLFDHGQAQWHEMPDHAPEVDVAVIEIDPVQLPKSALFRAFDPSHLDAGGDSVGIGDPVTILGFPAQGHDTANHLAVARSASIASSYGVRFRQQRCFLIDAPALPGTSGSPVLRRRVGRPSEEQALPWQLVGVQSPDADGRACLSVPVGESKAGHPTGLNRAWYADVLMALTQPRDLVTVAST